MKRILFAAFVALVLCLGAAAQSADAISKASTTQYYAKSSLQGDELWKALETMQCAISVATVNADGTPNAAVVIPGVTKDRSALVFGLAPNQTIENFKARKFAVVTAYIYNPTATEKLDRNKGARIVVEYISDPAEIKRQIEDNKNPRITEKSTFMKIVRVMPLG
ncbi:MAG: hypothetical protein JNG85_06645 [Spirochaetaceae bacterium]|nr:hypothetical protein [Spirochaetaceae bacterium]